MAMRRDLGLPSRVAINTPRCAGFQGLTLAQFRAQLQDLLDTSLMLGLNLSTFETHPRINLGHTGDKVSLS